MLRDQLKALVEAAVDRLIQAGKLPEAVRDVPVEIQDTKSLEHGDYACNLALAAAKKAGVPPRQVGEMLRDELLRATSGDAPDTDTPAHSHSVPNAFVSVDVAGPGFINLKLNPEYVASFVGAVLAKGIGYAHVPTDKPQRINVEFVSVNPNGPITVGSGRGAAFGSTLANVLAAAGHTVHREYYINDGVNSEQMRQFAESVRYHMLVAAGADPDFPERGYKGTYVEEVALTARERVDIWIENIQYNVETQKEILLMSDAEMRQFFGVEGYRKSVERSLIEWQAQLDLVHSVSHEISGEVARAASVTTIQKVVQQLMIDRQRSDLAAFGVEFDLWFSEQSLHDRGVVAKRIKELQAKGVADEEPYRTVLKMGKNGKIDEVQREEQPVEEVDDEFGETDAATPQSHSAPSSTLWLRSTKFGDDMDRVLRRKDGRLTYIASDVAYHADKQHRPEPGADKLITILGPDHHGYIGRLQAVFAALLEQSTSDERPATNAPLSDIEAKIYRSVEERDRSLAALEEARRRLEVVIFQIVRFVKDGKPAPMRKRDGNIYELRDLIDELGKNIAPNAPIEEQRIIGKDVSRFFYLMRSHDTHMDFDIDLATKQSDENPVFYAQYAHARVCSVLRKAGVEPQRSSALTPALLIDPRETALIKKILDLPMEVGRCAKDYGVHRLTTYAVELARAYHHFYDACRVIQPDQPELTEARVALCQATRVALQATFALLGVSAPERMERE